MRPPRRTSTWCCVVLLLPLLFAGCTEPRLEPVEHVRVSTTVGTGLYSWSDPVFTKQPGGEFSRRITGNYTVPEDVGRIGITFLGVFTEPAHSDAYLNVSTASGSHLLTLHAAEGRPDDHGAIDTLWQFQRVHGVQPAAHRIVLEGHGDIGHVEFQVHAIPQHITHVTRAFNVTDGRGDLTVEVILRGWGRTPDVTLTAPDGHVVPVGLDGADSQTEVVVAAARGTYVLDANTTGWGGRLVARVLQH